MSTPKASPDVVPAPVSRATLVVRVRAVDALDPEAQTGNGFLFSNFDASGLRWACDEAMKFYRLPAKIRQCNLSRVMTESQGHFNHTTTASDYIKLYEKMLQRPVTRS